MWTKLSSRTLLEHPRLKVEEDLIVLPNGDETTYLRYDEPGCAVTLIAEDELGRVLICKEYSYPPDRVLYQLPGGGVPDGEPLETGANRELMEETGLRAGSLRFLGKFLMNNRRSSSFMHVYHATDLVPDPLPGDPEESIECVWMSKEDVSGLIAGGEAVVGTFLAAWAIYLARS